MKFPQHSIFGALCLAVALAAFSARAAVDMFLDLGPEIPGETADKNYPKQVDVLAWSWSMSYSGATHTGGGGGSGKLNVQDLGITKYVDKASPKLMLKCATGAHIERVTLLVLKAGRERSEYIKITMTDVIVTSLSTGGAGGEDRLTENVTLNFAKVKYEYFPTKRDGTPDESIPFEWDIAENRAP